MKTYIFILFGLFFTTLRAQQPMPTQAFVPQTAQLVSSFRYNVLKTANLSPNLRELGFMQRLANYLSFDIFNQKNDSLFFNLAENPTLIGVDTNQLFHLASFRDTAGVIFYSLTLATGDLLKWKNFICKNLPRYQDSEFRYAGGNFYIARQDHAFIWNKSRISAIFMQRPPQFAPSWLQQTVYFEPFLAEYLNLTAANSLHNLPIFTQILADKTAAFYLYFNPRNQLIPYPTAASCQLTDRLNIKMISAPPAPLADLNTKKGNFPAARFASLLKNTNAAATFWAFFNTQNEANQAKNVSFYSALEYVKLSSYAMGKNTNFLDSVGENIAFQNAFAALNGHFLAKIVDFKYRNSDSLLLPVAEIGLDFNPKSKAVFDILTAELCRKNIIKLVTPPNLLFSYPYDKDWIWYIAVEKEMIYCSMQDKTRPFLNKAPKKNPILLSNKANLLEISPAVFAEKLAMVLDKKSQFQPLLKWIQTNVNSANMYSLPAQNGLIIQNLELTFNPNFKPTWALFFRFCG